MTEIGDPAPDFSDQDVRTGIPFTLSEHAGEVVVLTFSGLTWCGWCMVEMPTLQELWVELAPRGIQFVMVSYRDPAEGLLGAIEHYGVTMPVLDDPAINDLYGTDGYPTAYIIGRDLRVTDILEGVYEDPIVNRKRFLRAIGAAAGWPTEEEMWGCIYEIARRLGIWFLLKKILQSFQPRPNVMRRPQ